MNAFQTHQHDSNSSFNRIARIAAATVKSDVAFITLRKGRKSCVIGTHGMYLSAEQSAWENGQSTVRTSNIAFVANIKRDASFRNHPLLMAAPFSKSLLHVPMECGRYADIDVSISLVNMGLKWPLTAAVTGILAELAMLIGDALQTHGAALQLQNDQKVVSGFSEGASKVEDPDLKNDTSGQFLLSTLLHKTTVRNRKDVGFITLRTWSKSIKQHQIKALTICKAKPDSHFADAIATEVAHQVRKIFGNPRFDCVVPVPCGHSKITECLSVQIAKRVAHHLQIPFVDALEHANRRGKSHPRKNAGLKPPARKTNQKFESVLVVDDVATSGRHIELSIIMLREIAEHITAIAWIGPS